MGKDREGTPESPYFSTQFYGLERFLEKAGQVHFRHDSGVTIFSLNPPFYRQRFPEIKKMIVVRKVAAYSDGNGNVIEADTTVLATPRRAIRLICEPLRCSDGKILPPKGRQDIDLTLPSQKALRQDVESNMFCLDGISPTPIPLTELQPTTTS
ncbi:hypothetical protein A2165_02205 [Candidatus Curtissbacteria bacterium RBG_13_40_7]|uniref:Uncharacterized protein n=1 Tax=Candidatus Curtissbacteria bacterium RBG_13_40_7 TaxID=1797706 RepID=A0A1F5FYH8_9BACT|nr:MAG: hypothetical protein A2165_02205 [Candidatus Curtissbacteria bacterium RBG_13_40_7]